MKQKVKLKDLPAQLDGDTEIEIDVEMLKPKPWPEYGDRYWHVSGYASVEYSIHSDGSYSEDRIACHNVFRTEYQADEAARYQMILNAQLQASFEVDPDFVPDLSDSEQEKWVPYYDSDRKKFMSICWWSTSYLSRPVSTEEKAQAMCDILNSDEALMEVVKQPMNVVKAYHVASAHKKWSIEVRDPWAIIDIAYGATKESAKKAALRRLDRLKREIEKL